MMRRRSLRQYLGDTRAAAALEMAIWLGVIVVPMLSVMDIGVYVYRRMQVEIAGQQAVEAVRRACGFAAAPVTDPSQCASGTLSAAIAAGRTGTSLGANVTLDSGYPIEGYYCVNSSGVLTLVGSASTATSPPTKPSPFTCETVIAGSTTLPADYIRVRVSYAFTPMFGALSVASILTSPISREAWLRLG